MGVCGVLVVGVRGGGAKVFLGVMGGVCIPCLGIYLRRLRVCVLVACG